MFSVIIPLYNKAPYIEKSILSVLNQTYHELELIVVDDGSTDDSFAQLSVISHQLSVEDPDSFKKIKIVQQENQGVSTARNNGVKQAKYDYIAFLDADDWWAPTYLEEMKALIEAYPEAGIFGSSYFKVKNGQPIPARIGVESDFEKGLINYFQVYARTLWMPLTSISTVVKKSVFDSEGGFKSDLKLGEDFDLWVRIALKCPVAFLNQPLAYYNQDVEVANRAIGGKLYEPSAHMLFSDYGELNQNPDFCHLFEMLAMYGLLSYYMAGKHKKEVATILRNIHWDNHPFHYQLYYRWLPRWMLRGWMGSKKWLYGIKKRILKL